MNYRARSGRYARGAPNTIMGTAFEERLPVGHPDFLRPGNLIVLGTMNNVVSWAVMYLTKSEVSHVAIVLDRSTIVHMVPDRGLVAEPVSTLFGPNSRFLVCLMPATPNSLSILKASLRPNLGAPYNYRSVARKAIAVLVGRVPAYFRISFFVDIFIVLSLLDLPFMLLLGRPFLTYLYLLYPIAFLTARASLPPLTPLELETPASQIEMAVRRGGIIAGDAMGIDLEAKAYATRQESLLTRGLRSEVRRMIRKTTINVTNSEIGVLGAEIRRSFNAIQSNVSELNQTDMAQVGSGLAYLTEAVLKSSEISSDGRRMILQQLEEIGRQATLPPEERAKPGVLRALLDGLASALSASGGLAEIWSEWGDDISHVFGV
jgi:hypothetical protein